MTKIEEMRQRRVTDRHLRTWHWVTAFSFAAAYLTGESERWKIIHVTLGYTLVLLLVWRAIWGIWGPKPLQFQVWKQRLHIFFQLIREGPQGWTRWQSWQVPVIGASVVVVMMMLIPLVTSGYLIYHEWGGDWLEEVHELFGNLMVMGVVIHVLGLLVFGMVRRKNLIQPMVFGTMKGAGPDLIKSQKTIWALVLVSLILGFWGWQWSAVPELRGEKEATRMTQWLHPIDQVSDSSSQN
ncbi:MAG: hypothetical protein RLZZ397_256 [Pseudomonadota bacterium]